MYWEAVWKIAVAIIGSVGGAGVIILGVSKYFSNRLAERLQAKYQLELNAKLELVKANLENVCYVSKSQFDAEFAVYRQLSKTFYHALSSLESFAEEADNKNEISFKTQCYPSLIDSSKSLTHACSDAQDALNENAAFIDEEIFIRYKNLYKSMDKQFWIFINRVVKMKDKTLTIDDLATQEDIVKCNEFEEELNEINTMVRNYLKTLRIIE